MPKVPWSEFVIDKSGAHLLVGTVTGDKTPNLLVRHVGSLMNHLAKGEHSLTVNRSVGTAEIHCAFRQQADSFAASVQAMATDKYPGWLSQRAFTLDAPAAQRIKRMRDDLLRAKGTRPRRRQQAT